MEKHTFDNKGFTSTDRQSLPGFSTMFRQELSLWWGSGKRWIWVGILTLISFVGIPLVIALFIESKMGAGPEEIWQTLIASFAGLSGFALPLLTIILTAGVISEEMKSGTAEWIISKPISRDSFVLAKLSATFIGIISTSLIMPLIIFYIVSLIVAGTFHNPGPLLVQMLFVAIYMTFLIAATTMISTMISGRGGDIGLAFLVIILQGVYNSTMQTLGNNIEALEIPQFLIYLMPSNLPRIGNITFLGELLWENAYYTPLITSAFLTVLCVFLALFVFRRKEF